MADSEILNGGAFCYKQNKGWYKIYFFCKLYTSLKAQLSNTLLFDLTSRCKCIIL